MTIVAALVFFIMPWFLIIGVIGATGLLAIATEKIIKLLTSFCHITGLNQFTATAVIIALATSLPELGVSVISALRGSPEIAFGNAVGSNIVNLALIAGITAIWSRVIVFEHDLAEKKMIWPIAVTFLPFLGLIDGKISRIEGLLLVMIYIWDVKKWLGEKRIGERKPLNWKDKKLWEIGGRGILWITILLGSAELVVGMAKNLAIAVNLPLIFVGLFVVAVGTSLPELMFNLGAINHHHKSMAIGNIIGSNVVNATLVIGLAALIKPIEFRANLGWVTGLEYLFVVLLFLAFGWSKKRLERWEGLVLVMLFIYYTAVELMIR